MDTLYIDIITYGAADIDACGVYKYAESPDVLPLLLLYANGAAHVGCVDLTRGEKIPTYLTDALDGRHDATFLAYDATRTRILLGGLLGRSISPGGWDGINILAARGGYPLDLAACAGAMNFELPNFREGRRLERYYCHPDARGCRRTYDPNAELTTWDAFKDFCVRRAELQRAIWRRLRGYGVDTTPAERRMYELDQVINGRGVRFDIGLAEAALDIDRQRRAEIAAAGTPARYAAEARMTAPSKYEAILRTVCDDGRARGLMQYHGTHTGRWAGRGIQVHNLPKTVTPDIDMARELVRAGDYDALTCGYADIRGLLGELVRTTIIPSPGRCLLVCDFNAIEARVLAWLAGETWVLDTFRAGRDIYAMAAARMYDVPLAQAMHNEVLRQRGKVATLALGYGGGTAALRAMAGGSLSGEDLPGMVARWRRANGKIVTYWAHVYKACYRAIDTGMAADIGHNMTVDYRAGMLRLTLPSGRTMCYPNARITTGGREIEYHGIGAAKKWQYIRTYPGRLTENVVQAVARDLLAHVIMQAEARGWPVVLHVHDEIVIDADPALTVEQVEALFATPPDWARGLPLRAKGYKTDYYMKQ